MNGMKSAMKVRFKYVQAIKRKTYLNTYYRRQGQRFAIDGEPGTPEWLENYSRIHARFTAPNTRQGYTSGSMTDLMARYKNSPEYRQLKPKTKKEYERTMAFLEDRAGAKPAATLPRKFAIKLRNDNQDSPSRANKTIAFLRTLMNYAIDLEWRTDNPCKNIKKLKLGDGAKVWTHDQIVAFTKNARAHHRIAFELGLNTGQRLGDLLTLPWSAYDGLTITLKQQKTGEELILPCTHRLKSYLDHLSRRSPLIVTNAKGLPYRRVDSYSNLFCTEIKRMDMTGISFHGLRKTAASILAEEGCTDREIMAFTGHRSTAMVSHYTQQADQKRRATTAVDKLNKSRSVKHNGSKV